MGEPTEAPPSFPVLASSNSEVVITTSQQLEEFLRAGGETASGARVTADSAMRVGAVYACIRIIAGTIGTLPLDVKRRVNERERADADDHPLWEVLRRRPNQWQTPSEFKRMLQAHVLLRGNGYARIVKTGGRVLQLLPLSAERVLPRQRPDMAMEYIYRRMDGSTVTLPQEQVFHLRGMTLDGIAGVSPITYAREAIGLAMQTEKHGATLFKNGTQLGLVLEHPAKLGKEGLEFLHASLEAYRGAENAGKSFVAEEGMKVKTDLGMTSEDAQYLETRKFQRSDIAMFFGVPPHMLGDTEKSTSWGTGIEQQSIGFVTYTLEDWLTMWEEAVNRDLVAPSEPAIYARFNRAALVKGDMKSRWEAHVKALQWGVHSPNEVRSLEDENPRDGGDVYYPPPNTAGGDNEGESNEQKDPAGSPGV